MTGARILFADNDEDFRDTRAEFLRDAGYEVITASSPAEARDLLKREDIDLAILDLRLVNDDDDKDISGLSVAKDEKGSVPKIILTGFPSYKYVREALTSDLGGLSAVQDFVTKREGPDAMLTAIRKLLAQVQPKSQLQIISQLSPDADKRLIPVRLDISEQLNKDYEETRKQAMLIHRARLGLIIVGALVILAGGFAAIFGQVSVGIVSAVSGVITELLALLFTKFAKEADTRRDRYHTELKLFYERQYKDPKETGQ